MSNARDLSNNRLLTQRTATATTSGNSVSYTSIPPWVKRITIQFQSVSLSAAGIVRVRCGTASGLDTSNYSGSSGMIAVSGYSLTNGLPVHLNSNTVNFTGTMILENISGNTWVSSHNLVTSNGYYVVGAGYVALTGVLDRLEIAATDTAGATGAMNFDNGSVNIFYE